MKDSILDDLICKAEIEKFYRTGGWATLGCDPIRVSEDRFEGFERRK